MKPNARFAAAIVAAALVTTGVAEVASAASGAAVKTESTEQVAAQDIRIPETGRQILEGVHAARLALFDGNVDMAKQMVQATNDQINERAAEYAVKLKNDRGFAIPLESGFQFSEGFKPGDEHAAAINEAGALMQQGKVEEALDVMAKAGIELDIQVAVLPVGETATHLEQALADIDAGEFFKANLTLKSVATSVAVLDFKPGELPAQGYALSDILPG